MQGGFYNQQTENKDRDEIKWEVSHGFLSFLQATDKCK